MAIARSPALKLPPFVKFATARLAWVLLGYSAIRLYFYIYNRDLFTENSVGQIAMAFIHGVRFDLSAALFMNAILLLFWFLPSRWLGARGVRQVDRIAFVVINAIGYGFNLADIEFIRFIGKRLSYEYLFLRGDIQQQGLGMAMTYWNFAVAVSILMIMLYTTFPRAPRDVPKENPWTGAFARLAAVGLIVLGMRGGTQFKPLHPMHAYPKGGHALGLLTLNTPFNLIKSRPNGSTLAKSYFHTDREPILRLKQMTDLSRPPLGLMKQKHVVVLVLESFASEFSGIDNDYPGFTPFMDSFQKKENAFYFKNNIANGRRSIEGVPAVLCGLPALMEEAIMISDFSSDRLDCLPRILRKHGYKTYFLHGAHNGSMHFDTFSNIAGFENFIGLNEYPKDRPQDLDEYWGVLDEPMMQYAAHILDEAKEPTLVGLFSLTSHHPYYVPPHLRGKFPKGNLEIHETIGYTDYALMKFFETASQRPWFKDTIFVITGDHTTKSVEKKYLNLIGYFRVPLVIYIPGLPKKLNVSPDRITQHIDVQPSLFDLLGIDVTDRLLIGQSVFDEAKPGRAFNYASTSYWYIDPDYFVEYFRGEPPDIQVARHKGTYDLQYLTPAMSQAEAAKLDATQNLLSAVHYFTRGLMKNDLYRWQEKLQ